MAVQTLRPVVTRTLATSRKLVNGYALRQPATRQQLPDHLSWVPCQRQGSWPMSKHPMAKLANEAKPASGRTDIDPWALQAGRPDDRRTVSGCRLASAARQFLTARGQGHSSIR
jgi:hypothetical protein